MTTNSDTIRRFIDSLSPAEVSAEVEHFLNQHRRRTRSEAVVIASLLETQLRVLGMAEDAAAVKDILTRIGPHADGPVAEPAQGGPMDPR